jgi:hypothetical protein
MVRSNEVLGAGGMEEVNLVVEELLSEAREKALSILNENRGLLELISLELLDRETLNHAEIIELKNKITSANLIKKKLKKNHKETGVPEKIAIDKNVNSIDKISPYLEKSSKILKRYTKKRAKG